MKKLLSIILACAMIMSLFCVVPASATEETNQVLPYIFEDFETTCMLSKGDAHTVTAVDSGDAAHGKVAHISVPAGTTGNNDTPNITTSGYGDVDYKIKETFKANDKLIVSFDYKLLREIAASANHNNVVQGGIQIILWDNEKEAYAAGYSSNFMQFDNRTNWQHITKTITIPADFTVDGISYRFFSLAEEAREVYIDNFEMKVDNRGLNEKAAISHSGSGGVARWNNGMEIKGNNGITSTQHDGTSGTVSEIKANTVDQFNQIYKADLSGGYMFEHAAGDTIQVSAWVKLPAVAAADTIYYTLFNLTESIVLPIDGKSTDWQYIEGSMTASKDHNNIYYQGFATKSGGSYDGCNTKYWPKDADGNYISIYVDDWAVAIGTPSAANAVSPVITGLTAESAGASIVPSYTIKTAAGNDVTTDSSMYKIVGASGRVYASFKNPANIVFPAGVNETVYLEVVPVADGYIGDAVRSAALVDLSAFDGIQIVEADDAMAVISTDTAIENAKLIWVGYAEDEISGSTTMTGTANVDVTMDAYTELEFTNIASLGDFEWVRVFLWSDLDTAYAPLAYAYEG
ncbi:MAG: hypothetical protein J6R66_03060 [Clostridia bacterium]|nr:hypothetical protein [Clostridia bacterium]